MNAAASFTFHCCRLACFLVVITSLFLIFDNIELFGHCFVIRVKSFSRYMSWCALSSPGCWKGWILKRWNSVCIFLVTRYKFLWTCETMHHLKIEFTQSWFLSIYVNLIILCACRMWPQPLTIISSGLNGPLGKKLLLSSPSTSCYPVSLWDALL